MDFDEIARILEMMREHRLVEFELERENFKLRLRKELTPPVAPAPVVHTTVAQGTSPAAAGSVPDPSAAVPVLAASMSFCSGGVGSRSLLTTYSPVAERQASGRSPRLARSARATR